MKTEDSNPAPSATTATTATTATASSRNAPTSGAQRPFVHLQSRLECDEEGASLASHETVKTGLLCGPGCSTLHPPHPLGLRSRGLQVKQHGLPAGRRERIKSARIGRACASGTLVYTELSFGIP
jgi:hypothetical protein